MWIIPFKGRNHSSCYEQNFLWKENNVYIMDNHRAALWCWFQHLRKNEKIDLIHIDKHTDTLQSQLSEWVSDCPDLWSISIDEYLSYIHENSMGMDIPLFRWDNYVSIFLEKYKKLINDCIFAIHNEGDGPNFKHVMYASTWELPGNIDYWIEKSSSKFIINIDLDYFFYEFGFDNYSRFFSESYIEKVFSDVKNNLDRGNISCLTLCLSPECCGGWEDSEALCGEVVNYLGLDFNLPK